jgi:hypothetical protein
VGHSKNQRLEPLAMTARRYLYRRRRHILVSAGTILLAGILFIAYQQMGQPVLMAVGIAVLLFGMFAMHLAYFPGLLCPECDGNLAPLLFSRNAVPKDRRVRFCPYCGGDLDEMTVADVAASRTE